MLRFFSEAFDSLSAVTDKLSMKGAVSALETDLHYN